MNMAKKPAAEKAAKPKPVSKEADYKAALEAIAQKGGIQGSMAKDALK